MAPDAPQVPDDADGVWPPGRLYLAVRRAIEDEWQRCELTGPRGSGLRFVLVSEWSEEGATLPRHPAGSVVRAWIRDGGGLRRITPGEYGQRWPQDRWERRPFVSLAFHVCADGRHVTYSAVGGGTRTQFGGGRRWIDPADPRLYPSQPARPRADVHPHECPFCGSRDFGDLGSGPLHDTSVDDKGRVSSGWYFRFAVRCVHCHATFRATSSGPEKRGDHLQWRSGRGDPT